MFSTCFWAPWQTRSLCSPKRRCPGADTHQHIFRVNPRLWWRPSVLDSCHQSAQCSIFRSSGSFFPFLLLGYSTLDHPRGTAEHPVWETPSTQVMTNAARKGWARSNYGQRQTGRWKVRNHEKETGLSEQGGEQRSLSSSDEDAPPLHPQTAAVRFLRGGWCIFNNHISRHHYFLAISRTFVCFINEAWTCKGDTSQQNPVRTAGCRDATVYLDMFHVFTKQ